MKKKEINTENIKKNLKSINDIEENLSNKKNNKKNKEISGGNIDNKQLDEKNDNNNKEVTGGNIKEKKQLNPIMKEMNRFRNEIIGEKLGSKSPKLTIPPFKKCIYDARVELNIEEGKKNNLEVVKKAIDLFNSNHSKYIEEN